MPYIVLALGLIIGLIALFRFFSKASPTQIKIFFRATIIVIYCAIMLFFALTGRIITALALLVLAIPFVIMYFKNKLKNKKDKEVNSDDQSSD